MVTATCFGITLPSSGSVPRGFWGVVGWGGGGRVVGVGRGQKALGTLPEDGNVMPKHVGFTIHN
jgi:hypothetical protein